MLVSMPPQADAHVPAAPVWPAKCDLFGVQVSATNYDEAVAVILAAAQQREAAVVSLHAAHAVVSAADDPALLDKVNDFELVGPDGQPVRWALNWLHGTALRDRVYGPELMLRLCAAAAERAVPIYLYGGSGEVIKALAGNLTSRFPSLQIAGAESPPFRALTTAEDAQVVERINQSGAGLVFIGLGCPKQDHFAAAHRHSIQAVQVCVGAAFDFHAGVKKTAPAWMQRRGLEWLFRLAQEPRRLWKRYLLTNTQFALKFCRQWLAMKVTRRKQGRSTASDHLRSGSIHSIIHIQ